MRSPTMAENKHDDEDATKNEKNPTFGVNGNEVAGGKAGDGGWVESPGAQSRGNKGNGAGHLKSSETYDANGHNMGATAALVERKANHSARGGQAPEHHRHHHHQQQQQQSSATGNGAEQQQQQQPRQLSGDQANPSAPSSSSSSLPSETQQQHLSSNPSAAAAAAADVHDVNQKLEFTFANFDPRDFSSSGGADRLYLADDDHYSHEIKKNNALNQKFNNHNYYGHHPAAAAAVPYAVGYDATAAVVSGDVVAVEDVDSIMMGFVDGSAHSVSGMIGRPGSSGGVMGASSSVLIDKDLINDRKKPKPVAIGDSKFPPVNSKG